MLSQSYPPRKSRDSLMVTTHMNHDTLSVMQSDSMCVEKMSSLPALSFNQHNQLCKLKSESLGRLPTPDANPWGNHTSSSIDPGLGQSRLAHQQSLESENSHSNSNSAFKSVDASGAYMSHSNAPSPIMPILQRGQEPPVTPTLASGMPSISSQPPSISSAKEISQMTVIGSSSSNNVPTSNLAGSSPHSKHVPYPVLTLGVSSSPSSASAKSSTACTTLSPIPILLPVTPVAIGKSESKSPSALGSSAPPTLSLSSPSPSTPPKLTKATTSGIPLPSSPRTPQHSRNLFESVSGTFGSESVTPVKVEQAKASNHAGDFSDSVNSHHVSQTSDKQGDLFSSVLTSKELNFDRTVKPLGKEPVLSSESWTQNSKQEVPKLSSSLPKPVHIELPKPTSPRTEVVNLDFPVASEISETVITCVAAGKHSPSGYTAKTGLLLSTSTPVGAPSTSTLACHDVQSTAQIVDPVAETIASVAAGKDEASIASSSTTIVASQVKEPILETLASALGSSPAVAKLATKPAFKTFLETSATEANVEARDNGREVTESKMVTIQSSVSKGLGHISSRPQASAEPSATEASSAQSSEALRRRVTRKRKSTHSEGDSRDGESDASSTEATPVKQPRSGPTASPAAKSTVKMSAAGEGIPMRADSQAKPAGADNKDSQAGKLQGLLKVETGDHLESEEKMKEEKSSRILTPSVQSSEEKDNHRSSRPCKTSTSEDKEHGSVKEGRPHRVGASATGSSDESRSHRSSSNESKDSVHKESRPQRNPTSIDSKDGRSHRGVAAAGAHDEKDQQARDGRSQRASSSEHKESGQKETLHKDVKSHRGPAGGSSEEDQKESRSQRASSADDIRDKARAGKDMAAEKTLHPEKAGSEGKDDGTKKSHRIKRQFYAYVPEKSIDQTYFDTPILSGRTRSKNKPSDQLQQDGTPAPQEGPVVSGNSTDLPVQHPAAPQHAALGKTEGGADSAGGKRPTRSVRTKDSPQDQSANKRRRVQQNR